MNEWFIQRRSHLAFHFIAAQKMTRAPTVVERLLNCTPNLKLSERTSIDLCLQLHPRLHYFLTRVHLSILITSTRNIPGLTAFELPTTGSLVQVLLKYWKYLGQKYNPSLVYWMSNYYHYCFHHSIINIVTYNINNWCSFASPQWFFIPSYAFLVDNESRISLKKITWATPENVVRVQ